MSYDNKILELLKELKDNHELNEVKSLPHIQPREVFFILVENAYNDGLIDTSSKNGIIQRYKGGAFLAPHIWLTGKGERLLEGKSDTPIPSVQFNIGSVHGSAFGDHGTVTNNYGASISDINALIESMTDSKDREEATQLVEILEAKDSIKPGYLKRFDNLLSKYPELAKTAGKILLSLATDFIV